VQVTGKLSMAKGQRKKLESRTKFLLFDLIIVIPLLVAAGGLKLSDNQSQSIGTEVPVTICFVFGVVLNVVLWSEFEMHKYKMLVRSTFMGPHTERGEAMVRLNKIMNRFLMLSYLLLGVVPTMFAFPLNKSLGPVASNEWIIIIVRNCGVIFWQVFVRFFSRRRCPLLISQRAHRPSSCPGTLCRKRRRSRRRRSPTATLSCSPFPPRRARTRLLNTLRPPVRKSERLAS